MTLKEIKTMLSVPGVTVHYDHAQNGTKVPFITYKCTANNFFADDKTYVKRKTLRVVLYTRKKDETLEELLEAVFDEADLPWTVTEEYTDNEEVYMIEYETEVI